MYFPAKDMTLSVLNDASPAVMAPIGELKNVQMQIAHSEEDVSTKGSNLFQELYPQGSQHQHTITAEFVLTDAARFKDLQEAGHSYTAPVIAAELDDGTFKYTCATWQIANWQTTGGAFGAVQGTCTLRSSGTVTKTAS